MGNKPRPPLSLEELNKLPHYRYHYTMLYIDPKISLAAMKEGSPLFFSNKRRDEKVIAYKGHLILCKADEERTVVYAYDVRENDTNAVNLDAGTIADAKDWITDKLHQAQAEPDELTLGYEEVEITIPVTLKMAVFRDKSGKVTATDVADFLKAGNEPPEQFNNLGGMLATAAWNLAVAKVYEQAKVA